MTTDTPPPPPWGKLITDHRDALGRSIRHAAREAGVSPTTWTDIEKGFRFAAPGVLVDVRGTADKVAAMAMAVGVSPGELEEAGRRDAAAALSALLDAAPPDVVREETERLAHLVADSRGLTERQRRELATRIRDVIRDS